MQSMNFKKLLSRYNSYDHKRNQYGIYFISLSLKDLKYAFIIKKKIQIRIQMVVNYIRGLQFPTT